MYDAHLAAPLIFKISVPNVMDYQSVLRMYIQVPQLRDRLSEIRGGAIDSHG